MYGDRSLSMVVQPDQWARCAHDGTALLPGGGVELTWAHDDGECPKRVDYAPGGLAFDRWCRAYRSHPAAGYVEPGPACPGALRHPLGLAVDRRQRLYVAESGARAVLVADLWAQRVLRRVPVCGRPIDVAADCGRAIALTRRPDCLLFIEGRRGPRPGPVLVRPNCDPTLEPCRIASGAYVLWRCPTGRTAIVAAADGTVALEVDGATDVDVTADGLLVVARTPGESFLRFRRDGSGWIELEPVGAPGYDGGAVTIAPSGRIAFTTGSGIGWTSGSVARHVTAGSVTTYRLDSGEYRTRWGRLFLDACLPPSTSASVRFVTTDLDDVLDPLPATPAARGARRVRRPDLTPPLPSKTLLDAAAGPAPLFRRPTGREQLGTQTAADYDFETYEAPVSAAPGRYLWIQLVLAGSARVTPRVGAMRVERPGHQLLRTLPRAWSRADADADFLQHFLEPAEGMLHELDTGAAERAVLVNPRVTPPEALGWLASFAGLVLDRRWPEPARRTLIAEAYPLFRRRGTRAALARILEIYLNRPPTIIEQWQLRGLGGTVLGTTPGGPAAPAIGGSTRATGTLGRFTIGGTTSSSDSYRLSAHRFSVLIPGELTPEQHTVVRYIVDVHRPAHTVCDVCELGSGMRVGQRLRVNLTSWVGPGADWGPAVTGQIRVGGDGVVGLPAIGSRLGEDSRAGQVRVG